MRGATFGAALVLALWTGMTIGGPWTVFLANPSGRADSQAKDEGKTPNEQKRVPEHIPLGIAVFRGLFRAFDAAHDDINVLSTIAVAVFTFTLWRSTDKLWKAGEDQRASSERIAADQSREMQESIRHAEVASKAAAASVDLAREALTGLDRPYVFLVIEEHTVPEGITFGDLIERGNEFTITYRYKNFGKSPAIIRETAFLTKLYRRHEPIPPLKRQASNYTSQAKSRSWVIAGGEFSHPVRQRVDLTADRRMIAFLKAKTGGTYIHPHEFRDPAEQPFIAVHDRVRYEDTIGTTYMLYVGYAFMGIDFHLFHHEHETYARDQNRQP